MHAERAPQHGVSPRRVMVPAGLAGLALIAVSACGTEQFAAGAEAGPPDTHTSRSAAGPSAVGDRQDPASDTAVPPPDGPGDLSPIEVEPQPTLPPVDVGERVEVTSDLAAELSLVTTTVEASRPGEIAGEAAEVTVTLDNTGAEPRDASTLSVTVQDADGMPLSPSYTDPYLPLHGVLAAGESGQGVYVFTIEESVAEPLTVHVSPAADEPVAAFVGGLE